ncbi:MAG: acyl-CoA dehydrogenase family protein [Parahaliea sp.]
MTLVLNEDQMMLKNAAAGFLSEKAAVAQLRALRDSSESGNKNGYDPIIWREMAGMGWAGIAIDEAYGGLGYGYTGLGLVLEQVGRHLSCSPLESSVLVAATLISELGRSDQKEQWLAGIATGEINIALALQEGAHHAPEQVACTARGDGDSYILDGSKRMVLDAPSAQHFLVVARTAGRPGNCDGLSVFLVARDSAGLHVENCAMVDSRAAGSLVLNGVRVASEALLGVTGKAWVALEKTLDIANIGLASELLGLSVEAFERTIGYLQERRQFGHVIGSFQGLQHRAAQLYAELELARSIVLRSLHAIDEGSEELAVLASAAKAKLCEVAQQATNEAVQMHGGIGMTDEHDIGFFLKRARVLQHTFGDYHYHLDRFARLSGF